jgi:PAS domain-containing protein
VVAIVTTRRIPSQLRRCHPKVAPVSEELQTLRTSVSGQAEDRDRRVSTMTPAGQLEFVNQQVLDYFGKSLEELKGWRSTDTIHPDDLPRVVAALAERVEEQQREFRQILDLTPQMVAVFGPGRERLYANSVALAYIGATLEEWQRAAFDRDRPRVIDSLLSPPPIVQTDG